MSDETPERDKSSPTFARIASTTEGYEYFRCRANGDDSTVYLHQLDAIAAGADPYDVFHPAFDVHHKFSIPWLNYPKNVLVLPRWHNRGAALAGGDPAIDVDEAPTSQPVVPAPDGAIEAALADLEDDDADVDDPVTVADLLGDAANPGASDREQIVSDLDTDDRTTVADLLEGRP